MGRALGLARVGADYNPQARLLLEEVPILAQATGRRNGAVFSALGLLAFVGVCFGAAAVGSAFTTPSIPGWYAGLELPFNLEAQCGRNEACREAS